MSHTFLSLVEQARLQVSELTVDELKKWLIDSKPVIVVDVREESEWKLKHLAQSIHLSKGVIERDIERTIPNKQNCLILYCGGGFRSVLAAEQIQKMGYTEVWSLSGGFKALEAAGFQMKQEHEL